MPECLRRWTICICFFFVDRDVDGWTRYLDPESGCVWLHHEATGDTKWNRAAKLADAPVCFGVGGFAYVSYDAVGLDV